MSSRIKDTVISILSKMMGFFVKEYKEEIEDQKNKYLNMADSMLEERVASLNQDFDEAMQAEIRSRVSNEMLADILEENAGMVGDAAERAINQAIDDAIADVSSTITNELDEMSED